MAVPLIYLANPRGKRRRRSPPRGKGGRFLSRGRARAKSGRKRRFSAKARAAAIRNLRKARAKRAPARRRRRSNPSLAAPRRRRRRATSRRRRSPAMARVRHRRKRRQSARQRAASIRNLSKGRHKRRRRNPRGRGRSRSRRPRSRRRRRSYARNPRRRRRSRSRGRRHYARNPGRRRRRHHARRRSYRRNPGLSMGGMLPSFGQGKALVKTAGVALLGYVGTNAVMMMLDMAGVASLKAKITDPKMLAGANFVQRVISALIATKLLGRVVRSDTGALRAGAAANVGLHTVSDVVSTFGLALPSWGAPLLLGYSGGMGGFVTRDTFARQVNPGMRGYITAGTAYRNNPGSMLNAGYASAFPVPSY